MTARDRVVETQRELVKAEMEFRTYRTHGNAFDSSRNQEFALKSDFMLKKHLQLKKAAEKAQRVHADAVRNFQGEK